MKKGGKQTEETKKKMKAWAIEHRKETAEKTRIYFQKNPEKKKDVSPMQKVHRTGGK